MLVDCPGSIGEEVAGGGLKILLEQLHLSPVLKTKDDWLQKLLNQLSPDVSFLGTWLLFRYHTGFSILISSLIFLLGSRLFQHLLNSTKVEKRKASWVKCLLELFMILCHFKCRLVFSQFDLKQQSGWQNSSTCYAEFMVVLLTPLTYWWYWEVLSKPPLGFLATFFTLKQ